MQPGHRLAQSFEVDGPFVAVNVDITCALGEPVIATLELRDESGAVVGTRTIHGGEFPWDRFAQYLEVSVPAPAGRYELAVVPGTGAIGWRTTLQPLPPTVDDGVSPLHIKGFATRDGITEPGVRAIGVETIGAPLPVFRSVFTAPEDLRSARLAAVGLGYGEFSINGQPLGEGILDPAPSDYDSTILYRTYDVGALLVPGRNELRAELGRGFFSTRGASTWAWNLAPWHREPMLIAELELERSDGSIETVVSGPDWETSAGAVTSDVMYTGIVYDAGAGTNSRWEPATVVAPPAGRLVPAALPEIRRFPAVAPVTSTTRTATSTIHDFGRILAGRLAITLTAEPGARLTVRYGEYLAPDGSVSCDNILAAGETQTDYYLADGTEHERRWEAAFTYKGFQVAEIEIEGEAVVHDVVAIPLRTDVRDTGTFDSDEPTLTWIDSATRASFLNNVHGIPTDTPVYEKNGWTADAHLATEAVLHQLDLRELLIKWLDDHVDAQAADGSIPQIIPTPGWGAEMDPTWSSSLVLIAWNLYWEYGDRTILERYHDAMVAYTEHAIEIIDAADGIWPRHSWGDWLAPGHQFAPEGPAPTTTMMVKHLCDRMAQISDVLGDRPAQERYLAAAGRVARAYHARYFDAATGSYRHPDVGYRQAMNILPLAFDAVPDGLEAAVFSSLVHDIEHRTAGHLDCGSIGTKYLLPVLTEFGRGDLAVTVTTQQTRPGWGVWRAAGSDTLWESWDLTARSHEHYFLGSAAAWVQQRVGGLVSTAPGWTEFEVAPVLDHRIGWAAIAHRTPLGEASARWRRDSGGWDVEVVVPAGAHCTVRLPDGGDGVELAEGAHRIVRPVATSQKEDVA